MLFSKDICTKSNPTLGFSTFGQILAYGLKKKIKSYLIKALNKERFFFASDKFYCQRGRIFFGWITINGITMAKKKVEYFKKWFSWKENTNLYDNKNLNKMLYIKRLLNDLVDQTYFLTSFNELVLQHDFNFHRASKFGILAKPVKE